MSDNRRVAERAAQAYTDGDIEALAEVLHPDVVVRYPQSGEEFRGRDSYASMLANYPGTPTAEHYSVRGGRQQVRVSTLMPFSVPSVTVVGSGDTFVIEGLVDYPDGSSRHSVLIAKVQDSLIVEETSYFAEPFDPPEWRRPFVSTQQ